MGINNMKRWLELFETESSKNMQKTPLVNLNIKILKKHGLHLMSKPHRKTLKTLNYYAENIN